MKRCSIVTGIKPTPTTCMPLLQFTVRRIPITKRPQKINSLSWRLFFRTKTIIFESKGRHHWRGALIGRNTVEVYGWKYNISQSYCSLKEKYKASFSTHELNSLITDGQESIMFAERQYRPDRVRKEDMKKKLESNDSIVMEIDAKFMQVSGSLPNRQVTDSIERATRLPIMYYVMPNRSTIIVTVLAICMVDSSSYNFLQKAKGALKKVLDCKPVCMLFQEYKDLADKTDPDYFEDMLDSCK